MASDVKNIMIDDDDDNEVVINMRKDPEEEHIKTIIKQGLEDIDAIVSLLDLLEPLIEPFGDFETINEIKMLYSEVIPHILVGNYEEIQEGLREDQKEIADITMKRLRKEMFLKLEEKYNN